MSAEPRPLNVVVISEHVPLLHEVSWTLECVGYKVQTTHDFAPEALWRRYSFTDIVIVDCRGVTEPTAETFAHDSDDPLYRIFLYDPTKRTDFAAWYAAGANDAIRIPLSRGELLTRVRTAPAISNSNDGSSINRRGAPCPACIRVAACSANSENSLPATTFPSRNARCT